MARIRVSLIAPAVLGAALALSAPLAAQQPVKTGAQPAANAALPATHTVARGETLWSLAKQYLGDAYLWPEIYRLNTAIIEDPHWIYPGEVLKLPAGSAAPEPAEAAPARASDPNGKTVFAPRQRSGQRGERQSLNLLKSRQAVRPGEYLAAPYVWALGGPGGNGKVLKTAESQIVALSTEPRSLQSFEPIFVRLPAGARRANGERFMTFKLGPVVEGQGQIVLVTGIIELNEDSGAGDARAVIVERYLPVDEGQGVVPIDSLATRLDAHPAPLASGAEGRVIWLESNPVIAQIGSYLAIGLGSRDGLATGDQVTLLAPKGTGEAGERLAPESAGVAQILRVTPYGASAILLWRSQANIAVGSPARLSAKMP
ncbi:MAG: LysM peptidoglycan-binding domain-containing protein [Gemmatimonadetes bacterium]|nr:LysM peptidoglycan-binding domain-containing protein [Gemmatimonadota bacterium]